MSKRAEKSQMNEVEEILLSKTKAAAFSDGEQRVLHRAVGAMLDTQIRESIDLFARTVVGPPMRLMKAFKSAGGKGLPQKSLVEMAQPVAGPLAAGPPRPRWPLNLVESIPLPNPTWPWPQFFATYAPPYSFPSQPVEIDEPTDKGYVLPGTASNIVRVDAQRGNLSLAAVVGAGFGLAQGPETWPFGDENVASASIYQVAFIPAFSAATSARVIVDVAAGNTGLPGTNLNVQSENGWVGVVGYISLGVLGSSSKPVSTGFLTTWASNLFNVPSSHTTFQPTFSVSGTFDVPAQTTALVISVAAYVAALRVTAVEGYDQNNVGFAFLDANVQQPFAIFYNTVNPGPININDIGLTIY